MAAKTKKRKKEPSAAKGQKKPKGKGKNYQEQTLKFKSPAEFFAENQNIAGFDNPGKALYTTVRELVENSLDAAESIRKLPEIHLTITELSQKSFAEAQGLSVQDRVDKALYRSTLFSAQITYFAYKF